MGQVYLGYLLNQYLCFDRRVKQLTCLILHWANLKGILNTQRGYFKAEEIIIMIIFFLQTREPPLVINLQNIITHNKDIVIPRYDNVHPSSTNKNKVEYVTELRVNGAFLDLDIKQLRETQMGKTRNNEKIAELLLTFFYFYGFIYPVTYIYIYIYLERKRRE